MFILGYNTDMEINELKEKYYSLDNSYERYILLQEYQNNHNEDEVAKGMMQVLMIRYGNPKLRKPADHFMHACLMMKVMADERFGSFALAKKKQEYQLFLQELAIDDEQSEYLTAEWKHLARTYIRLSKKNNSKSYFFGMGKRDEHVVVGNVADEITNIFVRLPKRLGYSKEIAGLCQVVMDTFLEEFPNDEEVLNSASKK